MTSFLRQTRFGYLFLERRVRVASPYDFSECLLARRSPVDGTLFVLAIAGRNMVTGSNELTVLRRWCVGKGVSICVFRNRAGHLTTASYFGFGQCFSSGSGFLLWFVLLDWVGLSLAFGSSLGVCNACIQQSAVLMTRCDQGWKPSVSLSPKAKPCVEFWISLLQSRVDWSILL